MNLKVMKEKYYRKKILKDIFASRKLRSIQKRGQISCLKDLISLYSLSLA